MTNTVFIEHPKVPKKHENSLIKDLQSYAISVALKFPTSNISDKEKIKIAKNSVRDLLTRFELSTKNFGSVVREEVISNLQSLYLQLKKKSPNQNFLEIIKIIKLLRREHPRKYKRLQKSLEKQLNERQQLIFNIYLRFRPRKRRRNLTYKAVGRVSKTSPASITGDVKKVVKSLSKILKQQKVISRGR